jgi:hypothetical protein
MARLIRFLIGLAANEFYGEIRIRFRKGEVFGQIIVESAYLDDTLPEPDVSSPAYRKVLAETVRGVESSA